MTFLDGYCLYSSKDLDITAPGTMVYLLFVKMYLNMIHTILQDLGASDQVDIKHLLLSDRYLLKYFICHIQKCRTNSH